jgi:hypothetical protein
LQWLRFFVHHAAGYEPAGSSSAEFVRIIKSDAQKTAELMRVAGIKQE